MVYPADTSIVEMKNSQISKNFIRSGAVISIVESPLIKFFNADILFS